MAIRTLGHYIHKNPDHPYAGAKAPLLAASLRAAAENRLEDVRRFTTQLGKFQASDVAETLKWTVVKKDRTACEQLFQSLFGEAGNESQRMMTARIYGLGPIHESRSFANGLMQAILIAERRRDWATVDFLLSQIPHVGEPKGCLYATLLKFAVENDRGDLFDMLLEECPIEKYLSAQELLAAILSLRERGGQEETIRWMLQFGKKNQNYTDIERLGFSLLYTKVAG